MELIIHFGCLGTLFNKVLYTNQLLFAAGLKARRVMKDEVWVARKGKRLVNVMKTTLIE